MGSPSRSGTSQPEFRWESASCVYLQLNRRFCRPQPWSTCWTSPESRSTPQGPSGSRGVFSPEFPTSENIIPEGKADLGRAGARRQSDLGSPPSHQGGDEEPRGGVPEHLHQRRGQSGAHQDRGARHHLNCRGQGAQRQGQTTPPSD